uniref:FGENESH: predicted gene_1.20 protein n=1 Tax=Rhodotorula toruloides TaxID=5286 RepID=A0A0K3C3I9_RHOTO
MAFHDSRPLPDGWIQQFDHNHQRAYWVDTKTTPTRSIWTHPLDDPDYQASQRAPSWGPPPGPPPSHDNNGNSGYPFSQPSPSLAPPVPYATSPAPQEPSNPFGNPATGGGDNKKGLGSFVGGAAAGGMLGKIMSKVEGKMGGQNGQQQQYQGQYQQPPPQQQQGYAGLPAAAGDDGRT